MPLSTADKLPNAEPSILASLSERHCFTKAGISFNKLSMIERKQFYKEAVDHVSNYPTGNLSASEATRRVAMLYNINIPDCDRAKIRVTVCSRLRASKAMGEFVADLPIETAADNATANNGHATRDAKRRRAGSDGAKTRDAARDNSGDMLPSFKKHRPFKGASSHLSYQEILKFEATAAALRLQVAQHHAPVGETPSFNGAVKGMRSALAERGVDIYQSTCWTHLKIAIDNYNVGLSPQKPGGAALPLHLEKRIANVVRNLRGKKFPVFREEVLQWAEEAIKETEYADYFTNGKPTTAWYKGWLKRIEFTTGVLRPLEQTRAEWNTTENLQIYFEVARDVLLGAGVVVLNPAYDPSGAHRPTRCSQNLNPKSTAQTNFNNLPTPTLTINSRLKQANFHHWKTQPIIPCYHRHNTNHTPHHMPPHIALPKITGHLNSPAFRTQAGILGTGFLYHKDTLTKPTATIKEHLMGFQ
jgi:hypothetical protein